MHASMRNETKAAHVRFRERGACIVEGPAGRTVLQFRWPAWDEALRKLEEMNRLSDGAGRCLAKLLEWKELHPWWFGQDYLFRGLLLPVMRYRALIEEGMRHGTLVFANPPKDVALYILPVLRRLGIRCSVRRHSPSVLRHIREVAGFCLKLAVSAVAVAGCNLRPKRILLYALKSVDPVARCDTRLKDVYDELRNRRLPFTELIFSRRSADAWREHRLRGRPGIYYDQIVRVLQWLFPRIHRPALGGEPVDPIERAVIEEYWEYTVSRLRRAQILRGIFAALRPRVLLILDDNREMFSLIAAAKVCGIQTVSYQHGMLSRHLVGLFCYGRDGDGRNHGADRYFVWSEFARERLLRDTRLFNPEQVVVGGHIRRLHRRQAREIDRSASKIRVLWVGEPLADLDRVEPFVAAIAEDPRLEIRYRPRPDLLDAQHEAGIRRWKYRVTFSGRKRLDEDLDDADVVIGTYSSVLYECYLHLVPSVVMRVRSNLSPAIVEEEWAVIAETPVELRKRILEAASLTIEDRLMRQRAIWGDQDQCGFVEIARECERWLI